jgi:acetyl esterase
MLYHCGGFCIGTLELGEGVALDVVRKYGTVALSVDYRMAPEFPFQVAVLDCFDALKWVQQHYF